MTYKSFVFFDLDETLIGHPHDAARHQNLSPAQLEHLDGNKSFLYPERAGYTLTATGQDDDYCIISTERTIRPVYVAEHSRFFDAWQRSNASTYIAILTFSGMTQENVNRMLQHFFMFQQQVPVINRHDIPGMDKASRMNLLILQHMQQQHDEYIDINIPDSIWLIDDSLRNRQAAQRAGYQVLDPQAEHYPDRLMQLQLLLFDPGSLTLSGKQRLENSWEQLDPV
ncbi:hypothetical protein ACWJJH_00390 [Endozoicomonadaceae bacterium StTr2]